MWLLHSFVALTIILDQSGVGIINTSLWLYGVFLCVCVWGFTSDTGERQKDPSLWLCYCAIFPSLLWSRMALVSGMVALCLGDNALVIHTHYSNGCRYKELLTTGGPAALGLNAASAPRPLPSDCRPLQQAAPPLTTPLSLIQPLLRWSGKSFFILCVCVCERFLWVCAHACLTDIKIYGMCFGYLLLKRFECEQESWRRRRQQSD